VDESFEQYLAHGLQPLLRLAGALTGDRGLAEEIVQEVMLRASTRWPHIAATGSPPAYLRRMVVNEHVSWRRKWARLIPHAVMPIEAAESDHADQLADRDALDRLLDALPPRQRAVLVLRYYEGLDDDSIADILGCSAGTVRSHASRALAVLRINHSRDLAVSTPACRTPKES
jgi:RNA polymerase sigma-70 factor (sigma-E family)